MSRKLFIYNCYERISWLFLPAEGFSPRLIVTKNFRARIWKKLDKRKKKQTKNRRRRAEGERKETNLINYTNVPSEHFPFQNNETYSVEMLKRTQIFRRIYAWECTSIISRTVWSVILHKFNYNYSHGSYLIDSDIVILKAY
ncbi:hypothetical protein POVWA2_025130 [Plasmodium ovale wallikeri]|uniref:Uncharacterized protein n=1 Tax=Plasmodium ovale wallikeri TaxID=864142 RepID=A0A1A8YU33_PLAOA|nr:hypothetical protein POVWA1_025310 [Plasmodium ovale wallikeri]SBT35463.1 hypothetical protein POVWA2_025130 [Plasmodium ovale wallikeri]